MSERRWRWVAWTTRGVVLVGILALGVLVSAWLARTPPEPARRGPDAPRASVVVFEASPVEVSRQWRGFGTARARDAANVPARVTATVEHVPDAVDPGQPIERGALIAELDASDFEQDLAAAEERLEEFDAQLEALDVQEQRLSERLELEREDVEVAQRELDRARRLFEQNITSQQELDRARRELIVAQRGHLATRETLEQIPARRRALQAQQRAQQTARAQAQLNLQRTQITSPIAGVLEAVDVQEGESVAAGQRVARVVSLERIEVPLRLPASARAGVSVGDTVTLEAADASNRRWPATVTRIGPVDDAQTRTVTVYAEVQNPASSGQGQERSGPGRWTLDGALYPGMFVEGRVDSGRTEQRLVVPRRAIRDARVRTVEDGRVVSRSISIAWVFEGDVAGLGLDADRQWAVVADGELSPGQLVLASASAAVLDGERVEPMVLREDGEPVRAAER